MWHVHTYLNSSENFFQSFCFQFLAFALANLMNKPANLKVCAKKKKKQQNSVSGKV